MYIIRENTKNHEFMFVCDDRWTRTGFAHDCTLFINDCNYGTSHCYYINRTWESWTFQSVCINALYSVITEYTENLKMTFKEEHGYKIMTSKRKTEFNNSIKDNEYLSELNTCLNNLRYKTH